MPDKLPRITPEEAFKQSWDRNENLYRELAKIIPTEPDNEQPNEEVDDLPDIAFAKASGDLPPEDGYEANRDAIAFGVAEEPRNPGSPSQDASLALPNVGVFAVFDGMGGMEGDAAAAARAGVDAIRDFYRGIEGFQTVSDISLSLRQSFELARQNVLKNGQGGTTVGSLAVIADIDGERVMGIAHCGDTRIYRYTSRGQSQLTHDQGEGHMVFNCMGIEVMPDGAMEDEFSVMYVDPGDRIMICSDGITGDYPHQAFSGGEMQTAFERASPQDSAAEFLRISKEPNKKTDDKTVIVFDIPTI